MSTLLVRRPPPMDVAERPVTDPPVVVAAPPQQNDQAGGSTNLAMLVMPLVSGSGSLLITLTNRDRPLFAAAGLLFMVVSVGLGIMLFVGTRTSARRRQRDNRERYLDYLEGMRHTVREAGSRQRAFAARRHPGPDTLLDYARLPARRWERRPGSPDFLDVRVGIGKTPLSGGLSVSLDRANPLITYDPVCLSSAQTLVDRYAVLCDQPVAVSLARVGCLSIVGDRGTGRALARSVISQLVSQHAPDDLAVAIVRAQPLGADWEWVKWLPHTRTGLDAPGSMNQIRSDSVPLVFASFPELLAHIEADLDLRRTEAERRRAGPPGAGLRRLVVVIDGEFQCSAPQLDFGGGLSPNDLGIHLISLVGHRREEPEQVELRISLDIERGAAGACLEGGPDAGAPGLLERVDAVDIAATAALARSLSGLRLAEDDLGDVLNTTVDLGDILGVSDVAELDPRRSWRPGSPRGFLRVPVGIGTHGRLVHLDLKESARGGMGPHGLVVGATGSGKSEMLRTMVTSLVIAHPPQRLALLLVDFKGGATFAGFNGLPHLAGMVTNLAADPGLVQRFRDALLGEMTRRQRVLAESGNLANLHEYAELVDRHNNPVQLEPMPHLLVIIDEFTELLAARPDFAELFLAVGRIGRSIGIHLLLATQRLDPGKIRGLESHLSYRISLRTFSESESREALGVPDAYHLPPEPGAGYLKVDTTVFERFKAALVSAPYRGPAGEVHPAAPVRVFSTSPQIAPEPRPVPSVLARRRISSAGETDSDGPPGAHRTILEIAVGKLASAGANRVRPVWIAPLPASIALDTAARATEGRDPAALDLAALDLAGRDTAARGTEGPADGTAGQQPESRYLSVVLGTRDIPAEQRQIPLVWDFAGPLGNVLIVGAALSGKSVALRTLICSLALGYAPGEVAVYCLDYGGGSLVSLAGLPQVAGVGTRSDPERVRRSVADVLAMLDQREALMSRHSCDGADGLRSARRRGIIEAAVPGDVFLVIDGWAALREAEPDIEEQVMTIANRGPSLGVHCVLSAAAGSQVRMRLASAFPGRIELRLTESFDSAIDRRLAETLPTDVPGRALVPGGDFVQIALPRIDGGTEVADLAAGVEHLVCEVQRRWPGVGVSPVRVLPSTLGLSDLIEAPDVEPRIGQGRGVAVGLSERNLAPVEVNLFGMDPHLQVYGESQSGKSSFLRTLVRQLVSSHSAEQLGLIVVDYRRAHLDLVGPDHLLAYCTGSAATARVVTELSTALAQRLPGPDVTSEQLRARSWWRGREIVVVVDDYDLVSAAGGNPLATLTEFLPHGRDVGLHVVTARRTGGASRAMFEPLTQALSELGGPGLIFSGDRTEGRLVAGVASLRLPPGRALLARRGQAPEQVQIAWTDPV